MFEHAGGLKPTTHCSSLLQHVLFKDRDIPRKIGEILDDLVMKKSGKGLLVKILTTVVKVNNEIYDDTDSSQHNQLTTLQIMTQQVVLLNFLK